jgi:hypothetical protein
VSKPWFIDVLTYAVVGLWFSLTFATIQQYGPSTALLASSVVVLITGLFMIYGQRLTHLNIGNRIIIDLRGPAESDENEPTEWQKENR